MTTYSSTTSSGSCVFCKIADGSFPTPGIFWQNKDFMAFLSIYPNTKGFTVVIPKKHHTSDVLVMEDKVLQQFVLAAKEVSKVLLKHFKDVGRVGLIMEGTGVDHAHIKLFPMHGTEELKTGTWKQHPSNINTYFEKYEGYIASNDGPRADDEEIRKLAEELKLP